MPSTHGDTIELNNVGRQLRVRQRHPSTPTHHVGRGGGSMMRGKEVQHDGEAEELQGGGLEGPPLEEDGWGPLQGAGGVGGSQTGNSEKW